MRLFGQAKKTLILIVAVVFAIVGGVMLFLNRAEHIEDMNGADDFSLHTITEENIIKLDYGAVGGPTISWGSSWDTTVEFSAKKYTGVTEIFYDNVIGKTDFYVNLASFEVTGGNFRMVVVCNDEIVATLEPGTNVEYCLKDATGYISLRIAGESASFNFTMSEYDYDSHSHS